MEPGLRMLGTLVNKVRQEDLVLRLFTRQHEDGTYAELGHAGYAPRRLVGVEWLLLGPPAMAVGPTQAWRFERPERPIAITGYYLTGYESGDVFGSEVFRSDAGAPDPFRVERGGEELSVVPRLTLRVSGPGEDGRAVGP